MMPTASVFTRTVSLGTCFSNGISGLTDSTAPTGPNSLESSNKAYPADMHKIRLKNVLRVYKIRSKKGHIFRAV